MGDKRDAEAAEDLRLTEEAAGKVVGGVGKKVGKKAPNKK